MEDQDGKGTVAGRLVGDSCKLDLLAVDRDRQKAALLGGGGQRRGGKNKNEKAESQSAAAVKPLVGGRATRWVTIR